MNNLPRVTVTRTTTTIDERTTLDVGGEIDYSTAPGMYGDVLAMTSGVLHLVLDFSRVEFCDSSGLSALLGVWRRLHADGGTLTITDAPSHVAKAMRVVGMDELITVHPRSTGTTPTSTT
ncbi:anti-sigma B factor antagonist [Saccharothrix carnea]|uniref:Anti-sigma factor antagonist n=1 Tax=Saccharothrix carnea TaxID=1280637 RepID=A0A2P8HLL5_SACCR|nr:STAS domain-containing protein [Saccharothrix carnea]PSL47107.1 anti-sigma B factor antagonist [Saccharothrix carnea]